MPSTHGLFVVVVVFCCCFFCCFFVALLPCAFFFGVNGSPVVLSNSPLITCLSELVFTYSNKVRIAAKNLATLIVLAGGDPPIVTTHVIVNLSMLA